MIVTLINSSNPVLTVNATPATVNINDNDTAIVTISATTPNAAEPNTDGLFTVSLNNPISTPTTVTFTVTGTAIDGTDYTNIPVTVIIPANTTSVTIPVDVIDDLLVEPTETVIVTLVSTSNPSVTVNTTPATVNIANNDVAIVSVTATTPNASEPSTDGLFTVSVNNLISTPTTVTFTVTGTAINGTDYTNIPVTIIIPANTASVTIPVDVIDDSTVETPETVIITLVNTSNPSVTVNTTPATVNINDTDDSIITVTATTPNAAEPNIDGLFTISANNPSSTPTTVTFTVTGTAINGTDYTNVPVTVIIPANTTSVTIPVDVIDDATVELTETVVITLVSTNNPSITVNTTPATVNISDDEASTVSVTATTPNAAEPNTDGLFTISLTNPASTPTTVTFTVTGSAIGGTDYISIPVTVVIPANTASTTIPVTVINDFIVEPIETVIVTLVSSSNPILTVDTTPATVNITDDETATVSVTATTPNASEPNTDGLFTVSLNNPVSTPTTVTFNVTGTATNGTDYTNIPVTINIPANTTSITIPVDVINDSTVETIETVIITLVSTSNASVNVNTTPATVNIADEDSAIATVIATTPNASEPNTDGLFTVSVTNPISTPTTVTFTVTGTATNGTDYTNIPVTVVIPANTTSVTIPVDVIDDSTVEPIETVIVTLTSTSNPSVTVNATPATVNIFQMMIQL